MIFDKDFIIRLKKGEQACFETLFLETYASLCEYAVSFTHSAEIAEEAVQETFVSIWESRRSLDVNTNIRAYLFQSVKNRCIDIHRYEQIRVNHLNEISSLYRESEPESDSEYLFSDTFIQEVQKKIEMLPVKFRLVYTLHRSDGLTYREIADALEVSVKTVEYRMSRALEILRAHVDRLISSL